MRNTTEIRVWMLRNGHTVESIRAALGYRSHAPVSSTINGDRNQQKVLRHLLELGCPREYLGIP